MHYVGQKVMCIHGNFDASVVEWADNLPVEGKVYTIRCCIQALDHATGEPGLCYRLLELPNPKTEQGAEVCFSHWRFQMVGDEELQTLDILNRLTISENADDNEAGRSTAYIGSRNESGKLSPQEIDYIVSTLIRCGVVISEMDRVEDVYRGRREEALRVRVIYPAFEALFAGVQRIRTEMKQDAVGLLNSRGVYVRLTEDALLFDGYSYIVYGPSIKTKPGVQFDPGAHGFREYKDYWVAKGLDDADDWIDVHLILREHLESWSAFFFQPGDDISGHHPEWIGAAFSVDPNTFLIWHPNQAITEAGGPYIRMLQGR